MRCDSTERTSWGEHRCDLEAGHELPHQSELGLRCFIYWPFQPRLFVQVGDEIRYLDEMKEGAG